MAYPGSFFSSHGENHPTPSQVGIILQTSQDALHPVGEVDPDTKK